MIIPASPDGREVEELTHEEIVALYRASWTAFADSEEEAAAYGSFCADVILGIYVGPPVD